MMRRGKFPKVSFIIMSFNGGEIFRKCLASIRNQNYPKRLVEIVVVDDKSEDNSVYYARKSGAKVFISGRHDMYLSWKIALHKVTGDFVYMVDQDIELKGKNFIKRMVKPLLENKSIVASFTRAYPRHDQPWITRYISYHPFQCDPLLEFLTPNVEKTYVKKMTGYTVCKFELGRIPAESRMMYRLDVLKKTPIWKMDRIFDHDLQIKIIKAGHNLVAYVPAAGIYHHHAKSLANLLAKRVRNVLTHYFPYQNTLEYRWIDTQNKAEMIKLLLWVVYANLFIPALIRGFVRFLKYGDVALLMEPVVTITTTDIILWNFLKNKAGREIIVKLLNPVGS